MEKVIKVKRNRKKTGELKISNTKMNINASDKFPFM